MDDFFLELFSEEIPARMQRDGAENLRSALKSMLKGLNASNVKSYYAPRRIALAATFNSIFQNQSTEIRGPRESAPEAAILGFLKKHEGLREQLSIESGYYVLRKPQEAISLQFLLADAIPTLLSRFFSWPKSMRWGQSSDFTWVRPLRRIVCLLDGEVVPITLGPVTATDETEGHRFHAPGAFAVTSVADWQAKLREQYVIVDADERRTMILDGLRERVLSHGLTLVEDEKLLDEVAGLVEWPVPLIGAIDPRYMALPPEVRELSMKVNQRYFALRDEEGNPAPFFAFVANIEAEDGGATIIAGNERVLRARLADAEHFWNQDRKHPLSDYLPKLKGVTFHAKLGTQYQRAERIAALSHEIAELLGANTDEVRQAERAGLLAKADLVTGMVGEFPELQGIMGGYYANDATIGAAIRTHYQPKGPSDEVPESTVACAVALADKLDSLREFFRIGEKPSGSGDPYALRRAALGMVRIILENGLRLNLKSLNVADDVFDFIIERLRVKLRSEGKRHDILNAVFDAAQDDDLTRVIARTEALAEFLATPDGANLLAAYRRAANILKIENAKDGPHEGEIDTGLLAEPAERALSGALQTLVPTLEAEVRAEHYETAMSALARRRAPVDEFFDKVTVNAEQPELRQNRLRLLARLRDTMHTIANFSKIEG